MTEPVDKQVSGVEQPMLLTITEAGVSLRISRTLLYSFIRSGQLKTIKLGRRRLVHRSDLDRLLDTLRSAGEGS